MRKLTIAFLIMATFALSGCHKEILSEISRLKEDVTVLEALVADINSGVASLRDIIAALENNDHISNISPVLHNGTIISYIITFTSGNTITLKNGTNGQTPFIGIQEGSTPGIYYWTVRMDNNPPQWMTDSYGLKVRVGGVVPILKIEDNYWWVSYDEGANWTNLFWATGKEGIPTFQSINYSDPYSIVFTLDNGTSFTLPTSLAITELQNKCDEANENIAAYTELLSSIDTSSFITSVAELTDGKKVTGYTFTLASGKKLIINNGKDNEEELFFNIKYDSASGKNCWTMRKGTKGSFDWLLDGDKKLSADPTDGYPIIGVKDSLGKQYFTYHYNDSPTPRWILDGKGEKIQASARTGFKFIKNFEIKDSSITLTLYDDKVMTLPMVRSTIPSMSFSDIKKNIPSAPIMTYDNATGLYNPGVEAGSEYVVIANVRDTLLFNTTAYTTFADYNKEAKIEVLATGLDGCVVTSIAECVAPKVFTSTPFDVGSKTYYYYDIPFEIRFRTPSAIDPTKTSHIVVFLTFSNRTLMKVIEFKNITTP